MINKIIKNNSIYLPIFILISTIIFSITIGSFKIQSIFIDIIILLLSLLLRKEFFIYKENVYKFDLFLPILIIYSVTNSLHYTILLTIISISANYVIEKANQEEQKKPTSLISQIQNLENEFRKQKVDLALIEYLSIILSISITYNVIQNVNLETSIIKIILFILSAYIIKNILEKIFYQIRSNSIEKYVKKLLYTNNYSFKTKEKIIIKTILETAFYIITSIPILYVIQNSKISLLIILLLMNVFLRNTILNQILTLLVMLVDLVEKKDRYTFDHSRRVALASYNVAKELNLEIEDIYRIYKASLIHDFGKLVVPDYILHKKGKLTNEEFEIVKLHVKELKNILSSIYPILKDIIDIAELHHERLDGSGYFQYKEESIPLESRIIAIADTFDALVIDRPYRPGMPLNKSLSIIMEEAQKNKLDKFIAEIFINTIWSNEIFESIKRTKTMLKSFQGKIIQNFIEKIQNLVDDFT